MAKMNYLTNCTNASGRYITDMVDDAREISYKTFCKYVSQESMQELFPTYSWGNKRDGGLYLKDDYAVRFYKSTYRGKKCVFIEHSRIEYIFA